VLWKELTESRSAKRALVFEKFTVQKSYNRSGKLGILGLLGIRKINNLRIINTPCKTDPDQVHHLFNSVLPVNAGYTNSETLIVVP